MTSNKTLLIRPDGSPITCWQEWTRPKKEYQWKSGRSAMELARSWFRNEYSSPPLELLSLFRSNARFDGLRFITGTPELVTLLPERGEGRNHDLALKGCIIDESVTMCIEAKADEPFGNASVVEYWRSAINRREKGVSTRAPERIEALLSMVDPMNRPVNESPWLHVRYQLLTALCGTILQGRTDGSPLSVFVIHEFQTDETSPLKQAQNHLELERFLSIVSGKDLCLEIGKLYGPFNITGMQCLIGKIITKL